VLAAGELCVLTACGSHAASLGSAVFRDAVALQRVVSVGRSAETATEVGLLIGAAQALPGDREG
jgi:hypothetical protein